MESDYGYDATRVRPGPLCRRDHKWEGLPCSLRSIKTGKCAACEREKSRRSYLANIEARRDYARERARQDLATPEGRKRRSKYQSRRHAEIGRRSRADGLDGLHLPPGAKLSTKEARAARELASEGHPLVFDLLKPLIDERVLLNDGLKALLCTAGRSPSVARLVMDEQLRYWSEHPETKEAADRARSRLRFRLRYQNDADLRLYNREKSKRRKVKQRGQTAVQIPVAALRRRFNDFGNCCAYCGTGGDMQMDHVKPISKNGAHDIGNIVPACSTCNTSKKAHEMEAWYRAQPFFNELRLQRIRRVMRPPQGVQLAMHLPS